MKVLSFSRKKVKRILIIMQALKLAPKLTSINLNFAENLAIQRMKLIISNFRSKVNRKEFSIRN